MQLRDVIFRARGHLNDFAENLWTKEQLKVFLQDAHQELQVKLKLNSIPVTNKRSAIITIPPGTIDLTAVNVPPVTDLQPSDLDVPINLWSRENANEDFVPMRQKSFLPQLSELTLRLICWSWIGGKIILLPAIAANDIKIDYQSTLTLPVAELDDMGFTNAELYLAVKVAAMAAAAVGSGSRSLELNQMAESRLSDILRMNIKNMQSLPVRRKPYRRRMRHFIRA